jgi:hypothetical protein
MVDKKIEKPLFSSICLVASFGCSSGENGFIDGDGASFLDVENWVSC